MSSTIATRLIEAVVRDQAVWAEATVEMFGSWVSGLQLSSSDVDLVICGVPPSLSAAQVRRRAPRPRDTHARRYGAQCPAPPCAIRLIPGIPKLFPQPLATSPSFTQAQTATSWLRPIWLGYKQHRHSCAHCTLARARALALRKRAQFTGCTFARASPDICTGGVPR